MNIIPKKPIGAFADMQVTQHIITPEEQARQDSPSGIACPSCPVEMTVGENEAGGICCSCYFLAMQEQEVESRAH